MSKYKAVEAFGPLSTTLGACTLAGFTVITDEIAGQTWALRRLFHSPGSTPLCVLHNVDWIRKGSMP